MTDIAGWIAPVATMIAAMMTAANLGTRVTGWGFVVFTIGSVCWSIIGIGTGQSNLLLSNAFLTLVNLVGIWRWLGRQAKYDDGATVAANRSAAANVPTLASASGLVGAKLLAPTGDAIGSVVDAMFESASGRMSYVVVSEGGTAGVAERLHALPARDLEISHGMITCGLDSEMLSKLPVLDGSHWPERI